MKKIEDEKKSLLAGVSGFDVSEPSNQEWLLEVVLAAKADFSLNAVSVEPTWIEMLADFAEKQDHGFPIQKTLFMAYVEILKFKDPRFEEIVKDEIGTSLPGLAGEPLYASITFQSRASFSLGSFEKWTSFADSINEKTPTDIPPVFLKSDLFWNSARAQETIDATVNTWLLANLLCFTIILFFTQNLVLCAMIIGTIILMFLCIAGWLFAVLDRSLGPVQALGVSIFIGLSANYSLHVVHAYHRSRSNNRVNKVKEAVFITGSPICASAISTIGGCVFLFGCRTIPLVELGILICCVTAMALLYSMGFLLAWLLVMGPLPSGDTGDTAGRQLHRGDIYWLCHKASHFCFATGSSTTECRTSSYRQLRSGASSLLSSLKMKAEGKFSKKSQLEDEIKDTKRDNDRRTVPTFPSSGSNVSRENPPIQEDSRKNMTSEMPSGGEEARGQRFGHGVESATTVLTLDQSRDNQAPHKYLVNASNEQTSMQNLAQPEEVASLNGVSADPYSQNKHLETVEGYGTEEATSREHVLVPSTTSSPIMQPERDGLLRENGDTPFSSTQVDNQLPLENTPTNVQTRQNQEEDSIDNWDLSSIMSYFSSTTDRVETTAAQPTSMLVLGPQDDHSVASGLELDPMDQDQTHLPSNLDDDGSIPFDEI